MRRHVVLGWPLFLLPSRVQPRATAQSSVGSFLSSWPIQFHHLLLTSSLIFFASVISRTVLFEMCCCHRILRIFLRHDWCPFHERPLCLLVEHDGNSTLMQCLVSTVDDSLTCGQLHPARSRPPALADAENVQLVPLHLSRYLCCRPTSVHCSHIPMTDGQGLFGCR